jgi:hypothetical protein
MDERDVIRQIEEQMVLQGVSQAELGRRLNPESNNARQVAYAYLSGKRNFFTGTGKAILDALGLEVVIRLKQPQE